jgi:hypothetical protein
MSNNTWKQYGGLYKTDKLQNVSVGTLVADNVLLRQPNYTFFLVNGNLIVTQNITGGGDLSLNGNFYARENIYLNQKLFFGTLTTDVSTNSTYSFMYGNSPDHGFIGVNTTTPTATFDILGIDVSNVFTARTNLPTINNIIALNGTNNGLTVDAITNTVTNKTSTSINFYTNNTSSNATDMPDTYMAFIQDSGFIMNSRLNTTINAEQGNLLLNAESGNNVLKANQSTFISSFYGSTEIDTSNNTTINTGQTTTIKTINGNLNISTVKGETVLTTGGNTVISSTKLNKLITPTVFSNRGIYNNILGELVTIYDISSAQIPFLYQYYDNSSINTGSALTMVTSSPKTTTFVNLATPLSNGFSIGGGTFIGDQTKTRSVGMLGLTDTSGNFSLSQQIVSSTNQTKYRTTLGINTYKPKTEQYSVDINGATRIANGELTVLQNTANMLTSFSLSKDGSKTCMVVGSNLPKQIINGTDQYPQYVWKSTTAGQTWQPVSIDPSSELPVTPNQCNVYVCDSNYALISASNDFVFITNNGGNTWNQVTNSTANHNPYETCYLYQDENIPPKQIIFLGGKNNGKTTIFHSNTAKTYDDLKNNGFNISYNTSIDLSGFSSINACDGYNNVIYFVGNGGIKQCTISPTNVISSATMSLPTLNNGTHNYNSVYVYDTSFIIAVGNYITYTRNGGTTWSDSPYIIPPNCVLNSVFIYNRQNIVAVGTNGLFIYTNNGGIQWQQVPDTILNSSGMSSLLTSPTCNLTQIKMPDINSFIITVVNSRDPTPSKIVYGFFPNMFNMPQNMVLDVCGSSHFSGDVHIDYNLYVLDDTSLNGHLFVNLDTSLNSNLFVGQDTSLNGHLFVEKDTIMAANMYIGGLIYQF